MIFFPIIPKVKHNHSVVWCPLYRLILVYNQFHNILRLFDVLPTFSFTKSETMCDYDL